MKNSVKSKRFDVQFGIMNGMVACRDKNGKSQLEIGGISAEDGSIFVSVNGKKETVCGKAANGKFSGRITTLKTGGPYTVTLRIGKEKKTFKDVYVGDLWIAAGQSNMQGCGNLKDAFRNHNPAVRGYYMDDTWGIANDPLHFLCTANAAIHWDLRGVPKPEKTVAKKDPLNKGAGPCISFGAAMYKNTKVPQGIIACAHGGTIMRQWDPALKDKGDASLYGAMLNRFKRNGSHVSGVIWYQGESDATELDAKFYPERMDAFLQSIRNDLHDPNLPFILVQLANTSGTGGLWTKIRQDQLDFAVRQKMTALVPVVDLPLEDSVHLQGESHRILGIRMADAACALRKVKGFKMPILPVSAESVRVNNDTVAKIEISFKNVVGKLQAPGRAFGFNINGQNCILRVELKGSKAILYYPAGTEVKTVGYGCECNASCNVLDEAGRALPVFSLPITQKYPRTNYVSAMEVSLPVLMNDDVMKVKYTDIPKKGFYRQPGSGCWMVPKDLKDTPHKPGFRFFRVKYDNPKTQKLKLLVGYDGPSKIFFDGKEIHVNPNGTNPIIPDQYCMEFVWKKGIHEIVLAEAMHNGNSYGLSMILEGFENTLPQDMPEECKIK